MNNLLYLIKQAWLGLQHRRGFIVSVVITMGGTLGSLLAVLTLAYVMLYKPLPFADQERLFTLEHQLINDKQQVDGRAFTYPNLMYLYEQQDIFEQSALMYYDAAVITSLDGEPMLEVSYVNPQWFTMFDKQLEIGRGFDASEDIYAEQPVVVISHETWRDHFNERADILTEKITFGGREYQIIGVLSENNAHFSAAGPDFRTKLVVPWHYNTVSERDRKQWGNDDGSLTFIGKLTADRQSMSAEQIGQHLTLLVNDNWQEKVASHEFFDSWSIKLQAKTLKSFLIADGKNSVYLLVLGALGLVIIAGVNIANLFISRTAERQQTLAISAALGASKRQLLHVIVAETGLLMLLSIIVAQLIAVGAFELLQYYLYDFLPRADELTLNQFSIVTSLVLLVIFTFSFAGLCRRMINYRALNLTLQSSGKGTGVQVSKTLRNVLIASQIAVATALVFLNVVLYQDAKKLIAQPLGYQTEQVYAAVLALPNVDRTLKINSIEQLKGVLHSAPEISMVSLGMRPSIFSYLAVTALDERRFSLSAKDVDDNYFATIGQEIIDGDNFTETNVKDRDGAMIVNETFAKILVPNGSAVGFKFKNNIHVVGVVRDIKVAGDANSKPRFYYPTSLARNMLLIKVKPGQTLSRDTFLTYLKQADRQLSLFSFETLNEYKSRRLFAPIATATTTATLTLITILLSGIGLFGILKYSSQMRRFEIGTRLAIGAKQKDIVLMVLKDNAMALIVGFCVSLIVLVILYFIFSTQLRSYVNVELIYTFLATMCFVSILSAGACYYPLRKYLTVPIISTLKGENV